MYCPYCGEQHPAGARFCPKSGKTLPLEPKASQKFYIGLVIFSSLLVIVSSTMLVRGGGLDFNNDTERASDSDQPESFSQIVMIPAFTQQMIPSSTPEATPTPTSIPVVEPVELRINAIDGAEIVSIPEGEFVMGSDPEDDPFFWGAEAPAHTVTLGSYWIYRTEVTQEMYQKCVEREACPLPERINDPIAMQYGNSRFSDYPVVMVTWEAALSYCQWAGGRLPTEAEWEKAARGTDGRLFPWGNDSNPNDHAVFSTSSTSPVASLPYGASPYSVFDMGGNVLEWVNDYFDSGYYQKSLLENPLGPASGDRRVIRGGAFTQTELAGIRTVARASLRPRDSRVSVGFRCVVEEP